MLGKMGATIYDRHDCPGTNSFAREALDDFGVA